MRRSVFVITAGLLCLVLLSAGVMAKDNGTPVWLPGFTSGNGIIPLNVTGNPTCKDVTGNTCLQFKIDDGQFSGTYYITSDKIWWITINSYTAGGSSDKCVINWTSNFDIKCVIVKGGDAADVYNVYAYGGNAISDTSLSTPINSKTSQPAGISHIIFCYDMPTNKPVPEFPAFFVPLAGIIALAGLAILIVKK